MPANPQDTHVQRQLAQAPVFTIATSILSPTGASSTLVVTRLLFTNFTEVDAWVTVFHDNDGTTYNATTCLGYAMLVPGRSVLDFTGIVGTIVLDNESGNLAASTSENDRINVTAYGYEEIVYDGE